MHQFTNDSPVWTIIIGQVTILISIIFLPGLEKSDPMNFYF